VAQPDDESLTDRIDVDLGDQGPIELDDRRPELEDVTERSEAGARVVDGEANRDPEVSDPLPEPGVVVDRLVLRHLEDDRTRAGLPEQVREPGRVLQQLRRDVEVEPCVTRKRGRPGDGRRDRRDLEVDPEPDLGGRGEGPLGTAAVREPGQRLIPDGPSGRHHDDRLVHRAEGPALDQAGDGRTPVVEPGAKSELRREQERRELAERSERGQERGEGRDGVAVARADLDEADHLVIAVDRRRGQGPDAEPGERGRHVGAVDGRPGLDPCTLLGALAKAADPGSAARIDVRDRRVRRRNADAIATDGGQGPDPVAGLEDGNGGKGNAIDAQDPLADPSGGRLG
jgi:hypothetical protein